MRVAGLDSGGDWRFGKGKAVYKKDSEAIRQNVVTRLRSFENDWMLDMTHGEDWLTVFSSRKNEDALLRTIERCVLRTEGVRSIERLRITSIARRHAQVELKYTDLFDEQYEVIESIAIEGIS